MKEASCQKNPCSSLLERSGQYGTTGVGWGVEGGHALELKQQKTPWGGPSSDAHAIPALSAYGGQALQNQQWVKPQPALRELSRKPLCSQEDSDAAFSWLRRSQKRF